MSNNSIEATLIVSGGAIYIRELFLYPVLRVKGLYADGLDFDQINARMATSGVSLNDFRSLRGLEPVPDDVCSFFDADYHETSAGIAYLTMTAYFPALGVADAAFMPLLSGLEISYPADIHESHRLRGVYRCLDYITQTDVWDGVRWSPRGLSWLDNSEAWSECARNRYDSEHTRRRFYTMIRKLRSRGDATVRVPEGYRRIYSNAFKDCTQMRELILPEGVKYIEFGAFEGCTSLERISFPDSLREIEGGAFDGCTSLKSVRIPKHVHNLSGGFHRNPFGGCSSLEHLEVDPANRYFNSPEGSNAILDCDGSLIVACPATVIPQGIRCIYGAYRGASWLTEFRVPDSVEELSETFRGCQNLRHVELPVGLRTIGWCAFAQCVSLQELSLPEGLQKIGNSAFARCSSLCSIELPAHLQELGAEAFAACYSLREVRIPDAIRELPDGLFLCCTSLEQVSLPDGLSRIGRDVFLSCESMRSLEIPQGIQPRLLDLPDHILLMRGGQPIPREPEPVPYSEPPRPMLEFDASGKWLSLCQRSAEGEIVVPDGTIGIAHDAFGSLDKITQVVLPEGLTTISDRAFMGCSALREINFPASLSRIGFQAFSGCPHISRPELTAEGAFIAASAFDAGESEEKKLLLEEPAPPQESVFLQRLDAKIKMDAKMNSSHEPETTMIDDPDFPVGCKVRHLSFGEGIVKAVYSQMGNEVITVVFADCVTKKLYKKLAKLERLDG